MKILASQDGSGPSDPAPVERDSRGILDPWLLQQRVTLTQYPPPEPLRGVIDRFWAVRWDLPTGTQHRQQVLTHPAGNLSVGPPNAADVSGAIEARLYGVARRLSSRTLVGRGWTVAAMTTVGGLGALVTESASRFTDRVVPVGTALALDEAGMICSITAAAEEPDRVAALAAVLEGRCRPDRVEVAREVAAVARIAETDRTVRTLADLTGRTGIPARTLHRRFRDYAGVSPTWVIRRYRLLDAAESVGQGRQVTWAEIAAQLGYADQAHLIRDFRAAVGQTPAAYARAQQHHRERDR